MVTEPSPNADHDALVLGSFEVLLRSREVRRRGARRGKRISPKSLGVLLALAGQPGVVLSREELMEQVWPGRIVTNDVLTQAISQLRSVLADAAEQPRYIETIAKSGYRLLAEVSWQASAAAAPTSASADAPPVPISIWRRRPLAALLSLTLLGLIAAALHSKGTLSGGQLGESAPESDSNAPNPPMLQIEKRVRLTSAPAAERRPSFSPDGTRIAFSADLDQGSRRAVVVQAVAAFEWQALTDPEAGELDDMPRWSPDGSRLAFQRCEDETTCRLMSVSTGGGLAVTVSEDLGRSLLGFDWMPDGQSLVFGLGQVEVQREGGGLFTLELSTGQLQPLNYDWTSGVQDYWPRVSADGQHLAFLRGGFARELWVMGIAGGQPRRVSQEPADIRGFDWLADSQHLLLSSLSANQLQLLSINDASVQVLPDVFGEFPDLSSDGRQLILQSTQYHYELFRRQLDTDVAAERAFASSFNDFLPSLSPSGRYLAFYSDRSGELRIWVADLQRGGAPLLMGEEEPLPRFPAAWSEDSRHLLVSVRHGDRRQLLELELDTRRSRVMPLQEASDFALYLDDKRVAIIAERGQKTQLQLIDRSSGERLSNEAIDDVSYAALDREHHRLLFSLSGRAGLFSVGSDWQQPRPVLEHGAAGLSYKAWSLSQGSLYLVDKDADDKPLLKRYRFSTEGGIEPDGKPLALGEAAVMSISPVILDNSLWYSLDPEPNRDIEWLQLSGLLLEQD